MSIHPVYYFDSIDSTNRVAIELAEKGAKHGTAVLAAMQTGGRGRLGKSWQSIPGKGLYCSIIVRPDIEIGKYSQITLVTGVAVAKVVDKLTGSKSMLKWPNDIYLTGRKCGGILTESSPLVEDAKSRYAIIGIGLNINSMVEDFSGELRNTATSFSIESGHGSKKK